MIADSFRYNGYLILPDGEFFRYLKYFPGCNSSNQSNLIDIKKDRKKILMIMFDYAYAKRVFRWINICEFAHCQNNFACNVCF